MSRPSPYHEAFDFWTGHLEKGLEEDLSKWDLCTLSLGSKRGSAKLVAKQDLVMAFGGLLDSLVRISQQKGLPLRVRSNAKDGAWVEKGSTVSEWTGSVRGILSFERTVINLAGYVSGVATQTRILVDEIQKSSTKKKPRLCPTRKLLPHYRDIALHGVLVGGGNLHRVSAAGGVLIKENHVRSAGGIKASVKLAKALAPHGLKIEIEVRNMKELGAALEAGVDAVLLDNFSPEEVKKGVRLVNSRGLPVVVEVSGGIRRENIHGYLIEGVDVLSLGTLTHSVRSADLSLILK